jgi:carbon-monoxide dehydrogenase large subunit
MVGDHSVPANNWAHCTLSPALDRATIYAVGMVRPKTPPASPPDAYVGRRFRRKEDARLVTGEARYLGDAGLPRTLHVAFVRSPHAHAHIQRVELGVALRLPGVVAAYTGPRIHTLAKPIRTPFGSSTYRESDYPILAVGKVRFVGEPVVAVVAESRYRAEDAAGFVEVDYRQLDPVVTAEAATAPSAPVVHDELPGNLYADERQAYGDVDAAKARAVYVVEGTFHTQRSAAVPLECRGALAHYDAGTGRLTLWTSTQLPHVVRYGLAECLGMPEDQIHVLSLDVGGGFGNKASLDPEQVAVAAIARDLQRPIKWIEDRRENFLASTHGQEERIWLRLSADADGRFLTLESDIVLNGGAYSIFPDTPLNELLNCATCIVGPYKFAHYRYRARAVATTTCPHGPYRGVARPPANFSLERLVNILAARMRIDPIDVRRRNLLGPEDFPHRTVTGLERDSGNYREALELAVERLGYQEFKTRQAEWRAQGRLVGVGVACFAEECATGTVKRLPRKLYSIAGYDSAKIRVDAHGRATVFSSAAGSGQGHETTLAQLAADELGIPPEEITVRHNDTELAPYGMGSTGSRTAVSSGGAVILAARKIKELLLLLGAHLLNEPRDNVAIGPGVVYSLVDPARSVSITQLAWVAHRKEGTVPPGFEPGLEAVAFYDPPAYGVSSNAVHAVAIEIDPRTGKVTLLRYVVVEDTGRMINPTIVEGQVKGGVAQGIGKALLEEILYDEHGQLVNASLMDFLVPTAREVCRIDVLHMETPSPLTVGGMKGCAEGGIIGGPAAVGNAIVDALQGRAEVYELPFTPEKVWHLVRRAAAVPPAAGASE